MYLFDVYMEANLLFCELDLHLLDMRWMPADHPKMLAHGDLLLFIEEYEHGGGKWADGFEACQYAMDVLDNGTISTLGRAA